MAADEASPEPTAAYVDDAHRDGRISETIFRAKVRRGRAGAGPSAG